MNSSLLKHPIQLYNLVTEKNPYGAIQSSYAYRCSTKAHIIFNSENQVVSEGEIFFPITLTFIVRSYIPVKETDRIKWEDKFWKIMSINKNVYYNNIEIQTTLVNT